MRFLMILSVFGILFFAPTLVKAQGHHGFCAQADSTAATQSCLKHHLDSAQKKLSRVYKKLADKLEGDSLEELKELQKTWLTYRDAECMWEMDRSIAPSLKRVNEMACMIRVTENRLDLLTIALSDNSKNGEPREYGSFPRWMNVVAKDHPDIFWNYGKRSSFDLDCDDEDEFIMQGFTTKKQQSTTKQQNDKEGEETPSSLSFEKNLVLAVVQNPPIGRPTAKIFSFPVQDGEGDETVCSDAVTIGYDYKAKEKLVHEAAEGKESPAMACNAYLKINNKGCSPKIISWTGKEFALEAKDAVEDKSEKNKEKDKK